MNQFLRLVLFGHHAFRRTSLDLPRANLVPIRTQTRPVALNIAFDHRSPRFFATVLVQLLEKRVEGCFTFGLFFGVGFACGLCKSSVGSLCFDERSSEICRVMKCVGCRVLGARGEEGEACCTTQHGNVT